MRSVELRLSTMADNIAVQWKDYQTSFTKSFGSLRNEKDFFDVTLVSDDEVQVSAHKLILSACSPFFKNILRRNSHTHPLIYLSGVSSSELISVMDYIYQGEVMVPQKQFEQFLNVSQKLQLDGLLQKEEGSKKNDVNVKLNHPAVEEINFMQFGPDNPLKMHNKESPGEHYFETEPKIKLEDTRELDFLSISNAAISAGNQENLQPTVFSFKDMDLVDKKLEEFSEKHNGVYRCKICLKSAANRTNHYFHIETHMDGLYFQCDQCDRTTKTRNAMRKHYGFYHRHSPFQFGLTN